MAIHRPKDSTAGPSWLGFQEAAIVGVNNKVNDKNLEWADIALEIELACPGSDFTRIMKIIGKLEFDADGELYDNSLLRKLYRFFDVIGFDGGLNIYGEWETIDGKKITDEELENMLSQYAQDNTTGQEGLSYDFYCYVYQKPAKPGKDKDFYTEVYPRLADNNEAGRQDLENYINWLKTRGFLKEYQGPSKSNSTDTDDTVEGVDIL